MNNPQKNSPERETLDRIVSRVVARLEALRNVSAPGCYHHQIDFAEYCEILDSVRIVAAFLSREEKEEREKLTARRAVVAALTNSDSQPQSRECAA
jgi:hypothetical protein